LALPVARASGTIIAMDSNYRTRGWGGDIARARATFQRFWSLATIALPTFDDEQALWDETRPAETVTRLTGLGVGEVVVKNGAAGALIATPSGSAHVPCPAHVEPIDTTAAGDSFNAAYLATRLAGSDPGAAALAGHRLAGVVIRHRGAIVPKSATSAVL
jgi:2-dehydro-3-deoxygluconokinase